MTIYRTRYRDAEEHRWVSECSHARAVAEIHCAQIERWFAPR